MISGAHVIVHSKDPEADRAFLRDVLGLPHVDAGEGWLIFALPPSEVAVHPARRNDLHELYLICDDVRRFVARMKRAHVSCGPVLDRGWGVVTEIRLPGGGRLGVYEPRHPRPTDTASRPARARSARPKAPPAARPRSRPSRTSPRKRP